MENDNEVSNEAVVVEATDIRHFVLGRDADGNEVRLEIDAEGNPINQEPFPVGTGSDD